MLSRSWVLIAFILSIQVSRPSSGPQAAQRPLTMAQVWALNATYRDPRHGVTFRYPSVWESETQFGYVGSPLANLFPKQIVGFGYEEGGFPRERVRSPYSATNLEGVGIVFSAISSENRAKCERLAESLSIDSKHQAVVIGGRSFAVFEVGEAAMNQGLQGHLYVTFANHTCYLFETDVASAAAKMVEEDNISALTPAQNHEINSNLVKIMRSVRITSVPVNQQQK